MRNYGFTSLVCDVLDCGRDRVKCKTINVPRHIYIRYVDLNGLSEDKIEELEDNLKKYNYKNYVIRNYSRNEDEKVVDTWMGGY